MRYCSTLDSTHGNEGYSWSTKVKVSLGSTKATATDHHHIRSMAHSRNVPSMLWNRKQRQESEKSRLPVVAPKSFTFFNGCSVCGESVSPTALTAWWSIDLLPEY